MLGNDKTRDNVIGNPLACAKVFTNADIEALGTARRELAQVEIQAIKDVYAGPHDSTARITGTKASLSVWITTGDRSSCRRQQLLPGQGGFSMEFVNFIWFEHDPACRRLGGTTLTPPGPGEFRWLDFNFDTNTPNGPHRRIPARDRGLERRRWIHASHPEWLRDEPHAVPASLLAPASDRSLIGSAGSLAHSPIEAS